MAYFETKEEANTAIQEPNETTRYIATECEPKKQRINIDNQEKTHTNTAKEKEQKSKLLSTVTIEHRAQTAQQIHQNKIKSKELTI